MTKPDTEAWASLRKRVATIRRVGYRVKADLRPMTNDRARWTFELVLYAPKGGKIRSIASCYPDWFDVVLAQACFEHQFSQVRE